MSRRSTRAGMSEEVSLAMDVGSSVGAATEQVRAGLALAAMIASDLTANIKSLRVTSEDVDRFVSLLTPEELAAIGSRMGAGYEEDERDVVRSWWRRATERERATKASRRLSGEGE